MSDRYTLNRVELIGNVFKDPEIKEFSGGKLAKLVIGTGSSVKDKETGKYKKDWHNVSVWGLGADIIAKHVRKDSKIRIEGELRTTKYTDRDGVAKYKTEVVVNDIKGITLLDPYKARSSSVDVDDPAQEATQSSRGIDDDIPF
jgi:single-strand DNA-binding protein